MKIKINFGILYYDNNSHMKIRYALTMRSACIAAYNYMILYSNIIQATIFNTNTDEVIQIYSQ